MNIILDIFINTASYVFVHLMAFVDWFLWLVVVYNSENNISFEINSAQHVNICIWRVMVITYLEGVSIYIVSLKPTSICVIYQSMHLYPHFF